MFEGNTAWIVLYVMFFTYLIVNAYLIYKIKYGKSVDTRESFQNFQLFVTCIYILALIVLSFI